MKCLKRCYKFAMYNCIAIHDQLYCIVLQKKILQYIAIPIYCCIPNSSLPNLTIPQFPRYFPYSLDMLCSLVSFVGWEHFGQGIAWPRGYFTPFLRTCSSQKHTWSANHIKSIKWHMTHPPYTSNRNTVLVCYMMHLLWCLHGNTIHTTCTTWF